MKERLQEEEYKEKGAYHRTALGIIPKDLTIVRYKIALSMLPSNLCGLRCLDFGGGDGALSTLMANRQAKVFVVDSSELALSFAKNADSRLTIVQAKTNLPFPESFFDAATIIETLEHIPDKDELRALQQIHVSLKLGGQLILSVPSDNIPVLEKHYRHYNSKDLQSKLESAGFEISEILTYRLKTYKSKFPLKNIGRVATIGFYLADEFMRGIMESTPGLVACSEAEASGIFIKAHKIAV